MPYQYDDNRETYMHCLGAIKYLIDEFTTTSFIIVGDWNANLGVTGNSMFSKPILNFCKDNDLVISDKELLPDSSYTYISESSNSHTWIDHIVTSITIQNAIDKVFIGYDITECDHIPIIIHMNMQVTPVLSNNINVIGSKMKWDNFTKNDIESYCSLTDSNLAKVSLQADILACNYLKCNHINHIWLE